MTEVPQIKIDGRPISSCSPVYVIAEMSANHNQSYKKAVEIIHAAKDAGANAVKIQTYTADTMTLDCDNDFFKINRTVWQGKRLYQLYEEAFTPWEWQPDLKKEADRLGIDFFSSPFDHTAVDFLEGIDVPAYKIASFELVDIPLLERVAITGKPVILSTGMADLCEIDEAIATLKRNGCSQIVLLKCTSAYPALPEHANLKTIPHLSQAFNLPAGLSDHTLGSAVAVTAVALGACVVEKHLCLTRQEPGPDSSFSMEPEEFGRMVADIRTAEKALGKISYAASDRERQNRVFRRSLFAVENIKQGEALTSKNTKSIRPGYGLHPKYLKDILGKRAKDSIQKGTPLKWEMIR